MTLSKRSYDTLEKHARKGKSTKVAKSDLLDIAKKGYKSVHTLREEKYILETKKMIFGRI